MRILLVEDEADVRQFFARALSFIAPDAEVIQAADGREALQRFYEQTFDLILSDHRMPNLTGVELLKAVRAVSNLPFLLVTADRTIEHEALAAGVTELLSKPISIVALRNAITRYLP